MFWSSPYIALNYHGIHSRSTLNEIDSRLFRNSCSSDDFVAQMEILGRTAKPDQKEGNLPEFLRKWLGVARSSILITFDDGFSNNLRAAELVNRHWQSAPITVFLVTNLVGTNRSLWTVELALLILRGVFNRDRLEVLGSFYSIADQESRLDTFNAVRNKLKALASLQRIHACSEIESQALDGEIERLLTEYPEFKMLNLAEIREMQSMGVKFQPHGHNHEVLHSNQNPEVIEQEILASKEYVERELNETCSYFAYPNGNYCDTAISVLKDNGFIGAFATEPGFTDSLKNNFIIPRLTPNRKLSKFKRQLRGKLN